MSLQDLRENHMMTHLHDALERGEGIGHYGRLVFAIVGRHFLSEDELVTELAKDRDFDETQARGLVQQVMEKDYSPPRREKIMEYQTKQDFPILPDSARCGRPGRRQRVPRPGIPASRVRPHQRVPPTKSTMTQACASRSDGSR